MRAKVKRLGSNSLFVCINLANKGDSDKLVAGLLVHPLEDEKVYYN